MTEFGDKVAVVTGAAQGTGAAIAEAFAREGASVVVSDIQEDGATQWAVHLADEYGFPVVAATTDVGDPDACRGLIDFAVEHFGGLDILVNCAGIFARKPAVELEIELWRRVIDVCLTGAFVCSQAAARFWIEADRPGAIVNISSTASTHSSPGVSAYAAAKAGMSHLTRALGQEWASHDIRVNAVAPSHINVERLREVGASGIIDLEGIAKSIPMGRLAETEEIADAVLFLASDKARFITSQVLFVDGGFSVPPIYRYE